MTNPIKIYPPIPTPFNPDERIAFGKLEANLDVWINQPLDGIVMPGSNSEAAFLTREERIHIWRICATTLHNTGKRFIAGAGAETTAETIVLIQTAAELGAEAALVLPPYFYKPALTPEVLIQHYQTIAAAAPIPLLLYNVPAFTGIDFTLQILLTLADHPRIIGIKDSSANVVKMTQLLAARPDFQIFSGSAGAFLPFLSMGAVGGIMALANIAATPLHQLTVAFQNGDITTARHIQHNLVNINHAITTQFGVAGLKYVMDQVGLYGGPTRRPLLPLAPSARLEIDNLLHHNGLITTE